MMKSIGKLTLATILAALVVGVPMGALADGTNTNTPTAPAPKARSLPMQGKIAAMDKAAKTITLGDKKMNTFMITPDTKITKDGKMATLDDAKVGDEARVSYTKGADGKLTAKSLFLGLKKPAAPAGN